MKDRSLSNPPVHFECRLTYNQAFPAHHGLRAQVAMKDKSDDIPTLLARLHLDGPNTLGSEFSRHRDRLKRMVDFRLDARLRGRVSASDVLQEAYLDALKRLHHFQAQPEVPFFIWLRTVTIQRLIDVHRQHLGAKARNVALEVGQEDGGSIEASAEKMAAIIGDFTSPSQAAQRAEIMGSVRLAIDSLDPIDREVLALRHFEELSNQEVAAILGIHKAAASKRYVRALERLKDALDRFPGFEKGSP
jgi:RNA polymerase sigma-70 factor, ECF subfamily